MKGRPPGITRKTVNFSLSLDLIARLHDLSAKTMAPQSRIVERAIQEYIERQQAQDSDKMQG